jgi:hypothetical protein
MLNVSMDITDRNGDGSFDNGDTITFEITPLDEGYVFTVGLLWVGTHKETMILEDSFVVDNGKLYSWHSNSLPSTPWYKPYA